MPFVSIAVDVAQASAALDADAKRQVPFAAARAATELAFMVQGAERQAIGQLFRHARPFTLKSVLVDKATKASPTATVYIRPEAARYLTPYEIGGKHYLPGRGDVLLNPKRLRLDAYGQIRGRPRAIGDRRNVFVGKVETKSGPVWGFWQRLAARNGQHHLKLLVRAGEALTVTKRLGFVDRARTIIHQRAPTVFASELAKAIKSN